MVLLLTASADSNADFVISWLEQYQHPYLRLNADEILSSSCKIIPLENRIILNQQEINLDQVGAVWLYKFGGFSKSAFFHDNKDKIEHLSMRQLANEFGTLLTSILAILKDKNWLTPPSTSSVNKLDILRVAKQFDVVVPSSYVLSTKVDLEEALDKEGVLISKSLYEPYFIKRSNGYYSMFTKKINKDTLTQIPDTFYPSLVQRLIEKEYEIRTFYIDGEFYSMCIFSQQNKQTEVDFRKYDWGNPNRSVPYKLPDEFTQKLKRMLDHLGMNCCSLDIIKSKEDGKYYFLEINPTGQFGMVSQPCGYDLYNQIAKTLIKMDNAS